MVRQFTETRAYPSYSLNQVRDLAASGAVVFVSRRVALDVEALGYSDADVHHCLGCLRESDFRKSGRYDDQPTKWIDVYQTSHPNPLWNEQQPEKYALDEIFIKLSLANGCLAVSIHSFHGRRY